MKSPAAKRIPLSHSPKIVPAGEFKAKCLTLMDEVNLTGQEIEITKRGKTVARLVAPLKQKSDKPVLFGRMKGTAIELGDIIGPTGEIWEADR